MLHFTVELAIGYRSISGCSQEPWNDTAYGMYDPTEQRNCYIAALHSLLGKPWFAGWFWHEWTTDPNQGGTGDLSYSPRGKPAQEVLRRWSAAIATQRSISLMPGFDTCTSYQMPKTEASLTNMCATGAQWVTIPPNGFMRDTGDSFGGIWVFDTASLRKPASPCSTSLVQVVDWARERGLRVMLKPHIDCTNGAYRGNHDPQSKRGEWFDDYRDFIVRYARMAELMNCEIFCVGCEIDKTANDQADLDLWRNEIIPAVREVYSGPITYAQLTIDNQVQSGLWDDLDFVGVDAYFKLFNEYPPREHPVPDDTAGGQTPDTADLRTNDSLFGWEDTWLPQLETLYHHTEKPIVFTEVGYQAIDSSAMLGGQPRLYSWIPQHYGLAPLASFFGVCFPCDTLTGYAVGTDGVTLKTTTSGKPWVQVATGTQQTLRSVHFPCRDTGFAVGDSGTIVRFRSGGTDLRPPPSGFRRNLNSVFFPNRATGFAVGDSGAILRSTDYGDTWSLIGSGTTAHLWSVHFPTDSVGFVVGDTGIILKTTDCGANWSRCSSGTSVTLRSVYFFAPDSGYAVGDGGSFLQSFNGGEDWDCQVMPHRHPELRAVTVPTRRQYGDLSAYVAGQDWNTIRANPDWDMEGGFQQWNTHQGLRSICFPDSLVGFAVGDSGTIVKTSGGGRLRIDFNEQKNCYEAAFRALWRDSVHLNPLPWFYGFHWWAWWTDSAPKRSLHEPWIMDMCPQQKPAVHVLEDWYKRPSLVPQDTLAWLARRRWFDTGIVVTRIIMP